MQHLLEQAVAPEGRDDDPLDLITQEVEQDEQLMREMVDWDCTIANGMDGTHHA